MENIKDKFPEIFRTLNQHLVHYCLQYLDIKSILATIVKSKKYRGLFKVDSNTFKIFNYLVNYNEQFCDKKIETDHFVNLTKNYPKLDMSSDSLINSFLLTLEYLSQIKKSRVIKLRKISYNLFYLLKCLVDNKFYLEIDFYGLFKFSRNEIICREDFIKQCPNTISSINLDRLDNFKFILYQNKFSLNKLICCFYHLNSKLLNEEFINLKELKIKYINIFELVGRYQEILLKNLKMFKNVKKINLSYLHTYFQNEIILARNYLENNFTKLEEFNLKIRFDSEEIRLKTNEEKIIFELFSMDKLKSIKIRFDLNLLNNSEEFLIRLAKSTFKQIESYDFKFRTTDDSKELNSEKEALIYLSEFIMININYFKYFKLTSNYEAFQKLDSNIRDIFYKYVDYNLCYL